VKPLKQRYWHPVVHRHSTVQCAPSIHTSVKPLKQHYWHPALWTSTANLGRSWHSRRR